MQTAFLSEQRLGVLVWQRGEPTPVARLGLARDPLLSAAVAEKRAAREQGPGTLFHVDVPGGRGASARYAVVALGDDAVEVALVRPAE